jgi:hypothetical protein
MLTIFLRHDQAKTLDEINNHLKSTGWYKNFPPEGVEVLSWYVMMGIGQVVTLKFPAEKLRDIKVKPTSAPASASLPTIPDPIPRLPPVTIAFLLLRAPPVGKCRNCVCSASLNADLRSRSYCVQLRHGLRRQRQLSRG